MKKLILLSFLPFMCFYSSGQDTITFGDEAMLNDLIKVDSVKLDSQAAILIFNHFDENGFGYGKGFFIDHLPLPDSVSNNLTETNSCLKITPLSDSTSLFTYSYRNSNKTITDTCYVFKLYDFIYLAYPVNLYYEGLLKRSFINWSFGLTSDHDREIVYKPKGRETECYYR